MLFDEVAPAPHPDRELRITSTMRKNLSDLSRAVGWSPENLVIIRFGLNADFIDRHGLTWIDNLETSSGQQLDDPEHDDHGKAYVQDYIARFGVRKCEANALVVAPEVGRQLCRDAILEHVPADAPHATCAGSRASVRRCAWRSGGGWVRHDDAARPGSREALGGEVSGGQVLAPGPDHSAADRSLSVKTRRRRARGFRLFNSFAGDDPIACRDHVRKKLGLPEFKPKKGNSKAARRRRMEILREHIYRTADGAPHLRKQKNIDPEGEAAISASALERRQVGQ